MKLFGRASGTTAAVARPTVQEAGCPHTALAPHWESAADIGKPDKVTAYMCDGCRQQFPRDEGERMVADIAARLRVADATRYSNRR